MRRNVLIDYEEVALSFLLRKDICAGTWDVYNMRYILFLTFLRKEK